MLPILMKLGHQNFVRVPSKNYVTPRGREGFDDFVIYCYGNFEGREGYFVRKFHNGKYIT